MINYSTFLPDGLGDILIKKLGRKLRIISESDYEYMMKSINMCRIDGRISKDRKIVSQRVVLKGRNL